MQYISLRLPIRFSILAVGNTVKLISHKRNQAIQFHCTVDVVATPHSILANWMD